MLKLKLQSVHIERLREPLEHELFAASPLSQTCKEFDGQLHDCDAELTLSVIALEGRVVDLEVLSAALSCALSPSVRGGVAAASIAVTRAA